MSVYENKLLKDLSRYYCRVKLKDYVIICTRIKKYNIEYCNDNNYISLYNLITDKCDKIKKSEIISHSIENLKIIENIKTEDSFIKKCKFFYEKAKENNITDDVFNKLLMNETVVNNNLQELIYDFNFTIDCNDIINNIISEEKIDIIKESFIKMIAKAANCNKEELYELKKSTEDEEDKEDIDTIIEMFDECVEEVDLNDVKTLTELVECWPPLLMPAPDSIENFNNLCIVNTNPESKIVEFKKIVDNLSDKSIIKDFIEILDQEKNNIPVDTFNEYRAILNEKL